MVTSIVPLGTGLDDTDRLNRALHSLDEIELGPGTYVLTDKLTANRPITITGTGAILKWAALGTNQCGMEVSSPGVSVSGVTFEGPAASVYVANEDLVRLVGTSAIARLDGATFSACTFKNVGSAGIKGTYADNVSVTGCTFTGIGYAGAMFISCNGGTFSENTVGTVSPGTAGNMYGLSLSHDSTGWPGTAALQPFCEDWTVEENTIAGNAWTGIDSHGGSRIRVRNNTLTDCKFGIAVSSSSGAAANYAGSDNEISGNTITGGTRANTGFGININGGSASPQRNTIVSNNTITGHGELSNGNAGAILANFCQDCTIEGNVVQSWGSSVINLAGLQSRIVLKSNRIGSMASAADTYGYALYSQATAGLLTLEDNNIIAGSARPPKRGVQAASLATRPVFVFNDLYASTEAAFVLYDSGWIPT